MTTRGATTTFGGVSGTAAFGGRRLMISQQPNRISIILQNRAPLLLRCRGLSGGGGGGGGRGGRGGGGGGNNNDKDPIIKTKFVPLPKPPQQQQSTLFLDDIARVAIFGSTAVILGESFVLLLIWIVDLMITGTRKIRSRRVCGASSK